MKGGPGKNKQGDPMKPHKKKYRDGGIAEDYEKARKKQPTGRLTDRDLDATKQQKEMMAAYEKARKTEPMGRLTDRDVKQAVKRAGLK